MPNVLIVEDQKMIRSLLESYLEKEPGYRVVASITGASGALALCAGIDLVLMDVQTEHRENGLTAAANIRREHPGIKIIVVTSLVDYEVLATAKTVGADSLWYKDAAEGTLMDVVRRTMAGEHIFPDAPPAVEIGTARSTEFTKTELRVLRYLVRGLPYGRIASEMGVEVTTVKYHVTNMLRKTNLDNKLQLALAVSGAKLVADLEPDE